MSKRTYTPTYPAELRDRGVRLFREQRGEYRSDNAAYQAIAPKLGCSPDSLRAWCRRAEIDAEARDLARQLEEVQVQVAEMENLTKRLSDDFLDLDLLDERARRVLGMIRADEIVIR